MTPDDLDHAFSTDEDIVPSSGFLGAVMTSVLEEANAPAPIPFPWVRALVGFGTAAATLVLATVLVWLAPSPHETAGPFVTGFWPSLAPTLNRLASDREAPLVVGALLLTYLLVEIPRRLAGRR